MGRRDRRTVDRRLGISTSRKVRITVRPGDGPLLRYARDYEPTPPEVFDAMLTAVDVDPADSTFIDLGAGKGRVLCLAAGHPFRAVIGVELIESLAVEARANLAALDPAWVRTRNVSCSVGDAGAFVFPPGPKVVFMFNPFGPPVMKRVVSGLRRAHAEDDAAPLFILYYEPVCARLLDLEPWLARSAETSHWAVWSAEVGREVLGG